MGPRTAAVTCAAMTVTKAFATSGQLWEQPTALDVFFLLGCTCSEALLPCLSFQGFFWTKGATGLGKMDRVLDGTVHWSARSQQAD